MANYNEEPVYYCTHCLSLKIKKLDNIKAYECGDCHKVDIKKCSIEDWEKLYNEKYNVKFLNISKNGRE